MSIQLEAAQALAVVERARSLFGSAGPVSAAGAPLQSAADSAMSAGQQMSGLSGQLVDRHATVVEKQNRELSTAGRTDTALESQLSSAAQITQGGARQMDTIVARTRSIAEAAATARTPAAEMMVLKALRAQVAQAQSVTASTQQQASQAAGQVRSLSYGSGEMPQAPANDLPTDNPGEEPPHGKDPRYWLDVTKIVYVPEGELAPANSVQVGPNLWYPAPDNPGFAVPPPPPAQYPLEIGDVRVIDPESDALYPWGYQEIAPGIGVPHPDGNWVSSPWPPPEQPIDVRDVIQVGPDQLAPWGYVEYMPGWWVPDPSRSSGVVGN
ncbi:hypothetical protein [Mycolicibacterium tusciae]|uniref:hypothetical protein n=1 Tax=Mycolicibacterium tusciae TaxID=75922 RepID=UPI00024A4716|nr:hypothetical protein [Mycolicibacterium tusciae]